MVYTLNNTKMAELYKVYAVELTSYKIFLLDPRVKCFIFEKCTDFPIFKSFTGQVLSQL